MPEVPFFSVGSNGFRSVFLFHWNKSVLVKPHGPQWLGLIEKHVRETLAGHWSRRSGQDVGES